MTAWDRRTLLRALGATLVTLAVVWLVTAVSDEGNLPFGIRAGRTLPLAPLCGAVGAALALGTARVREETRALEALGRSPGQTARPAALGAAAPALVVALLIGLVPSVDVTGFYPRAARPGTFVYSEMDRSFLSATLGTSVDENGEMHDLAAPSAARVQDDGLPSHARAAAAVATALAGLALALLAARAVLVISLAREEVMRRRRARAAAQGLACAFATVVSFQAAAARLVPATLAVLPPAVLLALVALRYRARHERAR
ncbi:MAG: hypothetical protein JWP97_2309 [Labilithrix sp.]|nr:hypothetical protein [Labilithrix sp.]